ncbi:hypothetical protein [Sinanaerobacter chloroacetimidivorans]|uniref:Uncharacterized protein n=1 Tax=Sinanaerobacter chloroacetimidivorans TaxID=2818044 RepID=A0A8J8B226_9FIRM|nr:hypothetical protein [Sinanaerobacter chloroacetimidivorans]MBR0596830.1 hypothetical protein [Sinanaerobacter chloroacetimidivorans]
MIPNLFTFHGSDHKVGTTMLSLSIASAISRYHQNLKILQISMNGRESTEYIREAPVTVDTLKIQIENRMLHEQDFLKICKHNANLYVMAGPSNELEERFYCPEGAAYLLEEISPYFDIVIADSGNEIDNGLAIGALQCSRDIFYIVTQQETSLSRYEKRKDIYDNVGVVFSDLILNKYVEHDFYDAAYVADRMQSEAQNVWKVSASDYAKQAEMEHMTLIDYKNDKFIQDIVELSNCILSKSGLPEIKKQRKNIWRSFI